MSGGINGYPDDATKPSRSNRRRKRGWKLTDILNADTINQLPHCSTGLVSSNQTAQAALMRFFYARKLLSSSSICRTGQALERVAGYVWPVDQPVQSGSMIGLMWPGLKLTTNEITIMTNHAQKPAESSQTPAKTNGYQSLFNLIKHTPQGNCVICQDLTFDQTISLINEIPGSLALKFSKMEALS